MADNVSHTAESMIDQPEKREWKAVWDRQIQGLVVRSPTGRLVTSASELQGVLNALEADLQAAREALERIVDVGVMSAFEYSVKWGEVPARQATIARDALAA